MRAEASILSLCLVSTAACTYSEAAAVPSVPAGKDLGVAFEEVFAEPARLTVVYWPAIGECAPHEMAAIQSLRELSARYPDVRFVTAVPSGVGPNDPRYGLEYPGRLLEVEDGAEAGDRALGPRPRVAAWSHDGALVFARSLPPVVSEAIRLRDEIVWTRAVTAPLDER